MEKATGSPDYDHETMVVEGIFLCSVSGAPSPPNLRMANEGMYLAIQLSHPKPDQKSSKLLFTRYGPCPRNYVHLVLHKIELDGKWRRHVDWEKRLLSAHTEYDCAFRSDIDGLVSKLEGGNILSAIGGYNVSPRVVLLTPDANYYPTYRVITAYVQEILMEALVSRHWDDLERTFRQFTTFPESGTVEGWLWEGYCQMMLRQWPPSTSRMWSLAKSSVSRTCLAT
jgi:hypothetical protein